jgi:hypothetical protein
MVLELKGHLFVEGGDRLLMADQYDNAGSNRVEPAFRGPVVSLYFRL